MKKLKTILLSALILSVTGCDFLRTVAGRPTKEDIDIKKQRIEERVRWVRDSLMEEMERLRIRECALKDSLDGSEILDTLGVRTSNVFTFGEPVDGLRGEYNAIIGVYRDSVRALKQYETAVQSGFNPSFIKFDGGVRAVCLCSCDSLRMVADTVASALECGACGRDVWVYIDAER